MAHAWKLPSKTAPTRPCARKKVRGKNPINIYALKRHVFANVFAGMRTYLCRSQPYLSQNLCGPHLCLSKNLCRPHPCLSNCKALCRSHACSSRNLCRSHPVSRKIFVDHTPCLSKGLCRSQPYLSKNLRRPHPCSSKKICGWVHVC